MPVKKTHDYVHYYRGYWSEGGKCRIRIYREEGRVPVVICSQLLDNHNTSVTNMAEYLAAEVVKERGLPTPSYGWSTIRRTGAGLMSGCCSPSPRGRYGRCFWAASCDVGCAHHDGRRYFRR